MKKQVIQIYLLINVLLMVSCQDKSRDDAKFLGHYETSLEKTDLSDSYETIDISIDENDTEYPYLLSYVSHTKFHHEYFYGKKLKSGDSKPLIQNCQIKDGILTNRSQIRPHTKFELVEKDGKFIKFILTFNDNKPYIGTIKK